MLAVTDLNCGYGESKVLYDISVSIDKGKVVSLVGSNAAGKTTLLNTISGLIRPWGGKITFLGEDITQMSPKRRVEMGLIQCAEGRHLFPNISVYENILLGAYPKRARANKQKNINRVLEMFPILAQRKSQMAGLLSGGEQQMCAIGRALMSEPELLIMDEPSLGLAPIIVQQVFEIIRDIQRDGVTIFLVEQNVQKALSMATYGYVLESGHVTMEGSGSELLSNSDLRKAYLGI